MLRRCLVVLGALLCVSGAAYAQSWPARGPIRLIVPLTAGSATDVLARIVFDQVGTQIGQTIVVENRPGAAGTLGTAAVARSEPDGYTLLVNSSSHTVYPSTFTSLPFNVANDFSAIAPLASVPTAFTVSPAKGYKTLADFVAAAKAKPGEMNFGSSGVGNSTHFAAERFRLATGVNAVHIPFKGAPEALTEVMAGRVDFYFSPLPPTLSLARDNKVQILAVGSARRATALPSIPTTIEAGYANSNYEFWVGAFVPSATPRPIVERLAQEVAKALEAPSVRGKLKELGADPMPMTPKEFDDYIKTEIELNAQLVKVVGIKAN